MGYRKPNIDRVAEEGMTFTDYYAEQSCMAGRSSFITGQNVFRTGLSKVGMPAAPFGLHKEDPRFSKVGKQTIEDTGPLTRRRMETIDDETSAAAIDFMKRHVRDVIRRLFFQLCPYCRLKCELSILRFSERDKPMRGGRKQEKYRQNDPDGDKGLQ
jgi:hypothetical protein